MQNAGKLHANARTKKGHKCTLEEYERRMKGNEYKDDRKRMQHERHMKAKYKEHEVLPKHLKPSKQLLDPFPRLFRTGCSLHAGSRC